VRFWAAPRSLVATEGISVDFFSSGYLDISVPRVRPAWLCIHHAVLLAEWVSPFGHCRIKACCQLPDTFRRLPRPSSPLTAKASTVYAWSLDHITPSRLRAYSRSSSGPGFRQTTRRYICLNDTSRFGFEPKRLSLVYVFKERQAGLNAGRFQSLRVRYTSFAWSWPVWWSQSGSNRRPPACKAGALPAELWPQVLGGGSGRTRTTGLTLIRGAL
jgi:hypothetical protein